MYTFIIHIPLLFAPKRCAPHPLDEEVGDLALVSQAVPRADPGVGPDLQDLLGPVLGGEPFAAAAAAAVAAGLILIAIQSRDPCQVPAELACTVMYDAR